MKWDSHKSQPHYSLNLGLPIDAGGPLSQEKAKEILHHGEAHGKPLTNAQRGYFGARAGGKPQRKGRHK